MFTWSTLPDTEWALPGENMRVDVATKDEPTLALLAGVSKEKGIEHFRIFEKSVNKEKFQEYVDGLRAANPDDKICIFMDNLSSHTSEKSKERMKQLGFRWIFNVPYSPDFNAVEFCFSMVKRNFRQLRAKKFVGIIQDSHEAMIE